MTTIEIAEGLKQSNDAKLGMLKDMKERFNTMVDGMVNERSNARNELSELTEKLRLEESTAGTAIEPSSLISKKALKATIENAIDDCEAAHKLSVSVLIEEIKKASEQSKADIKALHKIQALQEGDAVGTRSTAGIAKLLMENPNTAAYGKSLLKNCESGATRIHRYNDILSADPECVKNRFVERFACATWGHLREVKAHFMHLTSLEFHACSVGIDLSRGKKEQMLDRWLEEAFTDDPEGLLATARAMVTEPTFAW